MVGHPFVSTFTFWLTFTKEREFGGVVIVDLAEPEIGARKWLAAATDKAVAVCHLSPGGYDVSCERLPAHLSVPSQFKNRLLNKGEVRRAQESVAASPWLDDAQGKFAF
jgi:hypothetical protein